MSKQDNTTILLIAAGIAGIGMLVWYLTKKPMSGLGEIGVVTRSPDLPYTIDQLV